MGGLQKIDELRLHTKFANRLCILANGPSSSLYSPQKFSPLLYDLWTVNRAVLRLPQDTQPNLAWMLDGFLHNCVFMGIQPDREFQRKYGKPLSLNSRDPAHMVQKFPADEVIQYFKSAYFTNTICWMLATAFIFGYEEIHLFGVDYVWERSNAVAEIEGTCYWIGRLNSLGVEVSNYSDCFMQLPGSVPYGMSRNR